MRVLVTGGAGFIGGNFVHQAVAGNWASKITVLDALTYAANPETLAPVADDVEFVHGRIEDEALVAELVSRHDVVINFAAESHNDNSLRNPRPFITTNVEGTMVLLNAVTKHDVRFHHISTDEVFGDLPFEGGEPFTPTTPYHPSSPYSASKAASDHLVRAWVRSFGTQATISNCSNNYGPYQHPEKFIPRQIINLLSGQPAKLYGEGKNVRDWIHVWDHNKAVRQIVTSGEIGQTYLIGAHGEASNKQVVELLHDLLGGEVEYVIDRPGHDRRYAIDPTSMESLGWRPQYTDLRAGLEQTVAWYRENQPWWQASFAQAEALYAQREQQG